MEENKNNFNFDTSDSCSIQSNDIESQQENETQLTRPPQCLRCNVYQCKNCNGNRPKLSQKQLEIIKKKNLTRLKPIPYKTCNFRCAYCLKIIPKSNQFIYERNLEIQERKAIQEKQEKPHEFKQCIPQNPISPPEKSLANISKPLKTEDRSLFSICKVKGDGNCTIRAILQSVGLT